VLACGDTFCPEGHDFGSVKMLNFCCGCKDKVFSGLCVICRHRMDKEFFFYFKLLILKLADNELFFSHDQ
jgi:hypothetical protein